MTALERTQQADAARWQQTPTGPVYVVERVVVERVVEVPTPARPSTWSTLTPEVRVAAVAVVALGVLVFLSLFALAGDGNGATALFVGLVIGTAATLTFVMVVAARGWTR